MAGFCVILSGRLPGDKDDATVWAPLKAAFKLEDATFSQRVLSAVPLIVRQKLDEAAANNLVQKMQASGIDAAAAQDDPQLAYFERGDTRRGPVPRSALGNFILPGERYRLRGEQDWNVWASSVSLDEPLPAIAEPATTQPREETFPPAHQPDVLPPTTFVTLPAAVESDAPTTLAETDHDMSPLLVAQVEAPPTDHEHFDSVTDTDFPEDSTENAASLGLLANDPVLAASLAEAPKSTRSRTGLWVVAAVIVVAAAASFAWASFNDQPVSPTNAVAAVPAPPLVKPVPALLPAHAGTAPIAPAGLLAEPAKAGTSKPASAATSPAVTALSSPVAMPFASLSRHCEASASNPQAPEEVTLLANGQNHLTGRNIRTGPGGEIFIVEAALGYDGQCRPSPFQVYVFSHGTLAGTLSPQPMQARTDGAISDFKLIDPEHLQIDIEHYKAGDPACCASSHELAVVDLRQFSAPNQSTAPARASSARAVSAGAAVTPRSSGKPPSVAPGLAGR